MTNKFSILLLIVSVAIVGAASAKTSEEDVNRIWVEPVLATKISDAKVRRVVIDAALRSVRKDSPRARVKSIEITGYYYEVNKKRIVSMSSLEEDDLKSVTLSVVIDIEGDDDLFCEADLRKKNSKWEADIEGCEI